MTCFAAPPGGAPIGQRKRAVTGPGEGSKGHQQRSTSTWLQQLAAWWPSARLSQATVSATAAAPLAADTHSAANNEAASGMCDSADSLLGQGSNAEGWAGASSASQAQVLDGVECSGAAAPKPVEEHLIVMVHGLFGTTENWKAISQLLAQHLDPTTTVLFVSHCNERQRTFEGVDVCGERLAEEIRRVAAQHPGLKRISIMGHSMGGLISRYAAGRLYDPASGTMAGLSPCHFIAMATPHLGCDAQHSPAQVPLINWLSSVPAVGSIVSELAAPVSQLTLGRVGRQFFLSDAQEEVRDASTAAEQLGNKWQQQGQQHLQQLQQEPQQQQQQQGGRGDAGGSSSRQPLIYRLTQDHPEEGLLFMSALASFETRTLYANSSGDHLVGWANSSLRRLQQLPAKSSRGSGVIREDPLETAWAPHKRPQLHVSPAAAALHSDEARRLSEQAILSARSAGQLGGGGTSESKGAPGGGALPAIESGSEEAPLASAAVSSTLQSQHQQQLAQGKRAVGLAGVLEVAACGGQSLGSPSGSAPSSSLAGMGSIGSLGSSAASLQLSRQVAVSEAAGVAGTTSNRNGGWNVSYESSSKVGSGASVPSSSSSVGSGGGSTQERQRVEEMLCRLQALSWRRVDVCFGATLLPLLSHQHIQMQRWWVNWPGRAVVKHLALQIQAMEQLRQHAPQRSQHHQH